MNITRPKEPVYYYECSAGTYRLVYFMPPETFGSLLEQNKISKKALTDLPDGVDLGCTEPDFDEFEGLYGYRPPHDPVDLRQAFLSILSSTRRWKTFRGTGFIPAARIESQLDAVQEELKRNDLLPKAPVARTEATTLRNRRRLRSDKARYEQKIDRVLQKTPAESINPRKTLGEQEFFEIAWSPGKPAEELFTEIHQKQKR